MTVDVRGDGEDVDEAGAVDLEALLVALVLVPQSYPRNRFFHMFRRSDAHAVRRRAALLRSVIADLADDAADIRVEARRRGVALCYQLPELGVRRTTLLERDELALVKHAVDRRKPGVALPADAVRASQLERLLSRLFPAQVAGAEQG